MVNFEALVEMLVAFLDTRDEVCCGSEDRQQGGYTSSDDRYIRFDTASGQHYLRYRRSISDPYRAQMAASTKYPFSPLAPIPGLMRMVLS